MAVFIKIRNKFGVIIAVVIGLLLAVFVLESALNSNSSLLKGKSDAVGRIDGSKISYEEFDAKFKTNMEIKALQEKQQNRQPEPMSELMVREQTWNQMMNDMLNHNQYDRIGIRLTEEEFSDMLYSPTDAHPLILQNFSNPELKQFDPTLVKNYLNNLEKDDEQQTAQNKIIQWMNFVDYIREDRMSTKYKNLLKGAIYVPKWVAEMDYAEKNTFNEIQYALIPYTSVSDSDKNVLVTDADIIKYEKEHKEEFKITEPTRKIDYILYTVIPSKNDTDAAKKTVYSAFEVLGNNPEDTVYLKKSTDIGGIDKRFFGKSDLKYNLLKDTIEKVKPNTTVGPFFEDGSFILAVIGEKEILPDSIRSSHILFNVKPDNQDTLAIYKKADSIYHVILNGGNFYELAKTYSSDGTKDKGGDIGWAKPGYLVKNYDNFLFHQIHKGADSIRLIKTEFGYHIVKIVQSAPSSPHAQVNYISRKVESSSETDNNYFNLATQFVAKNTTAEKFNAAVKEQNLRKITAEVKRNDYKVNGLEADSRELIRWANESEKGAISQPVRIDNDKYVVALLADVNEGELESPDAARPKCEKIIRDKKKSALIMQNILKNCGLNPTLESVAAKMNVSLKDAGNVNFGQPYIQEVGYEIKLTGSISALPLNVTSAPIEGNSGVYVVRIINRTAPSPIADYNQQKQQIAQSDKSQLESGLIDFIKKAVTIEDNRYKFF